jgi:ubiquitin C-terminal hydrolase
MSNSEEDTLYRLFAVVVHIGTEPGHGHYVALIRSMNTWWVFDDTLVEPVEESYLARVFGWGEQPSQFALNEQERGRARFNPTRGYGNMYPGVVIEEQIKTKLSGKALLSSGSGYILFYESLLKKT